MMQGESSLRTLPLMSRQPLVLACDSPGLQLLEQVLHVDHSDHLLAEAGAGKSGRLKEVGKRGN